MPDIRLSADLTALDQSRAGMDRSDVPVDDAVREATMSLNAMLQDIDDWCGTPIPGHPPRPKWLRDILTAVVLAEMSTELHDEAQRTSLYDAARELYRSAAEQVALNPQPLPPLREPNP